MLWPARMAASTRRVGRFQTVPMGNDGSAGVKVNAISEDNTPGRRIHDPSHPLADGELCHPFQRERCGRDGQHDLSLAFPIRTTWKS